MNRIDKISLENDNLLNKMNKYYHLSSISFYSIDIYTLSYLNDLINSLMNNVISFKDYEEVSDIINNSIRYNIIINLFTRLHVIIHKTEIEEEEEHKEELSNKLNELSITLNTLIPVFIL